jgi:hypothetical protein
MPRKMVRSSGPTITLVLALALMRRNVLQRHWLHHVNFDLLSERRHTGGRVGNGREDRPLDALPSILPQYCALR